MKSLAWVFGVLALVSAVGCSSQGDPTPTVVPAIHAETQSLPPGGAGQLYNVTVYFSAQGGAALPDRFELAPTGGALPPGISLMAGRADLDGDGVPDEEGPLTGQALLVGYPRTAGSYTFTIRAISTGALLLSEQPNLVTNVTLELTIEQGSVAILNPASVTVDPAVPAFPEVIDFVNPSNPQAFFSFAFQVAGGSGNKELNVYMPRELELSVFDGAILSGAEPLNHDTDETLLTGDPNEVYFADGGVFRLQAGSSKIQVGGFQSPRGDAGATPNGIRIDQHGDPANPTPGLNPAHFQQEPGPGPARNSRRTFGESVPGGDSTLGPNTIHFSDYFDDLFEGTHPTFVDQPGGPVLVRRKYPFTADQYANAFVVEYQQGVDLTPLQFRLIVEAVDTRGTASKVDDVIDRKAYVARIRIPDIVIDTVLLKDGQAGIEYTEVFAASGGVPPLSYDFEWADGTADMVATPGDALTQDLLGIEVDGSTGQFFGVPAVSGAVELTMCAFAAVMNPSQAGGGFVPTGNPGEFSGTHPLTGVVGLHRTITVRFATPPVMVLANVTLKPGIDGFAYPGETLSGTGGVPQLVPSAVGFVGTYPSSTVVRSYAFSSSYTRDQSHADVGTTVPGLPNALVLDGDPNSANNGKITGTTYDRGFHPIFVGQIDFYLGDATNPDLVANRTTRITQVALSVSPDSATYLRGDQNTGGEKTGILEPTPSMASPIMVPMFQNGGIYLNVTGEGIKSIPGVPNTIDFLPLGIPNGGSDNNLDKTQASVVGVWPAESNKNDRWEYYYYGNVSPYLGWKHLQQETTWLQMPTPEQTRVFLWSETVIKKYAGPWGATYGSSYANNHRYQIMDRKSGKQRGVFILNPLSGDFWMPAILTNSNAAHGSQFGTEDCLSTSSNGITDASYSDTYAYYWCYVYGGSYNKYYSYMFYGNEDGREARLSGGGSFMEAYALQPYGPMSQGHVQNSVAVSADGLWCATALVGGDRCRILLWRTDKQPIPAAILSQGHVTALNGKNADGSTLSNSACIIDVSQYGSNPRFLLPDSLMFVKDGLLFLMEKRLDYINGVSLVDGHLSTKSVNQRTALSSAQGTGQTAPTAKGMPVPDQDFALGMKRLMHSSVQFSFTGNKPADGEEGPDKLAFIAGELFNVLSPMDAYSVINNQGNSPYYKLSDDAVRKGMSQGITGTKAVLFLELQNGASGLELSSGVIKDLSGDDNVIKGDYLTPGRIGQELDFLSVSPDGKYVAAVRNVGYSGSPQSGPGQVYTYYYYSYAPTFGTISTATNTTTTYYQSSDDLVLFSTEGKDLDTASGTQTVLFLGTGVMGPAKSAPSTDYASGGAYLTSYGRRLAGVNFSPDSKSVIFYYQGHDSYNPKYMGSAYQYCINASSRSTTYDAACARISIRFNFRTSSDQAISFGSSPGNFLTNNLASLSGVGGVGATSAPFGAPGGEQQFWATFKSPNGQFLYYISDNTSSRNHMVGFNIGTSTINGHDPWVPFSTHGSSIGFEQFDCTSWDFDGRFAASGPGVVFSPSGRDGAGIVFVIGSDASAGALSATDLDVYALDTNIGGSLVNLTADVTDGTANAINHLYASADGNFLVGQRAETAADSGDTRVVLNNNSDLFAVINVHAALAGAAPIAFMLSEDRSHGSTVSFVGEGTASGPAALVFSSADKGTSNTTWDDRTVNIIPLAPGAVPVVLDSTKSHYVVLAGSRKLDDDPNSSN